MFLLFVNDLAQELSNPWLAFADDAKVAEKDISLDLAVKRWSARLNISLYLDRCRLLTANADEVGSRPLRCDSEVRGLGIIITHEFQSSRQSDGDQQGQRNTGQTPYDNIVQSKWCSCSCTKCQYVHTTAEIWTVQRFNT